jgi:hypothetical protein
MEEKTQLSIDIYGILCQMERKERKEEEELT